MPTLIFGKDSQIQFQNDSEFYEALGFLAKSDGTTTLVWEPNEASGAWGSEGRIQCYKDIYKFPTYFSNAFTAGNGGKIIHRINCNDYVEYISQNHNFVLGPTQNVANIKNTVPANHIIDFDRGYNL